MISQTHYALIKMPEARAPDTRHVCAIASLEWVQK